MAAINIKPSVSLGNPTPASITGSVSQSLWGNRQNALTGMQGAFPWMRRAPQVGAHAPPVTNRPFTDYTGWAGSRPLGTPQMQYASPGSSPFMGGDELSEIARQANNFQRMGAASDATAMLQAYNDRFPALLARARARANEQIGLADLARWHQSAEDRAATIDSSLRNQLAVLLA